MNPQDPLTLRLEETLRRWPLSGVLALRLYESALIRQTESELIAQGALVAASYHAIWRANGGMADPADPPVDPR